MVGESSKEEPRSGWQFSFGLNGAFIGIEGGGGRSIDDEVSDSSRIGEAGTGVGVRSSRSVGKEEA